MGATGLLHDPRMFSRTTDSPPRDPFALAREYLRFVAQYPIASPYGIRNVRDHMRRMLRSEIKRGGPMFEHMFEAQQQIQRHEQFCALVSALAAALGLEAPPQVRRHNFKVDQDPSACSSGEQQLLSMKQIKTWSPETSSSFECRCRSCHA